MTVVACSAVIAASPELVWSIAMDPTRLAEWVTIHRSVHDFDLGPMREGSQMRQILHLRGTDVTVRWQLTECDSPYRARWEGRGPAWSHAHIEYRLRPVDGGTQFDYMNEFAGPLGLLGAVAGRALIGTTAEREAERSLARLKALVESAT